MDTSSCHFTVERPDISLKDLRLIRRYLPSARRILDVGTGYGGFVGVAEAEGFTCVGLDRNPDARYRWPRPTQGVIADAMALPFADRTFDVVRAKDMIEHLPDPLALVTQMARLLKPGGLALIHAPSVWSQFYPQVNFWDDPTHLRMYRPNTLRRLAALTGLRVLRIYGYAAGRLWWQRVLTGTVGRLVPHEYLLIAQRPEKRLGCLPDRKHAMSNLNDRARTFAISSSSRPHTIDE